MQFLSKVLKTTPMVEGLWIEFGRFSEEVDAAPLVEAVDVLKCVRTVRIEDFTRSGVRSTCELLGAILRSSNVCVRDIRVLWRSSSQPLTSSQIAILRDSF